MTREELWFNTVSLENNEQYVTLLLKIFNIEEYNFTYCGDILSLSFQYQIDSYRCDIDRDEKELILLKRNLCGNSRKDRYHVVKKFDGVDVWFEVFKFITKRG